MVWNDLAPVLLPCPDLVQAPSCAASGSRSLKDESHFSPQMLWRAEHNSGSLVSHLSVQPEGRKGFIALSAEDAGCCSDCTLRSILAMPGQASGPFFLPEHGHAVTSLQNVAILGECPAHTGFNEAPKEVRNYPSFCAGLIWEEMWHMVTAGRSFQQATHLLRGLSNSSFRASPGQSNAPCKEPSYRLKHGCQTWGCPQSSWHGWQPAVNLGRRGEMAGGSSALAEAARACGCQQSCIPAFLSQRCP